MEWLSKALDYLKLPLKHAWVVTIATGLLLFLPTRVLDTLHLSSFTTTYGAYIGTLFLVTAVLVSVNIISYIWIYVSNQFQQKQRSKQRIKALHEFDPQEKAIFREFAIQGQNTILMPIEHPVVAGLLAKRFLVQITKHGERSLAGMLFAVKMADDVERCLTPEMIQMPANDYSELEIEWLRDNRPDFMPEIEHHRDVFHRSWRSRGILY